MSKYTIWDLINNVYHKKMRYPTDKELSGQIWMINRWLSMDKDLLEVVSELSKYMFCLAERYYRLLYRIVPRVAGVKNKYAKVAKASNEIVVKKYAAVFGLSTKETRVYVDILQKKYSDREILDYIGEKDGLVKSTVSKKSTNK